MPNEDDDLMMEQLGLDRGSKLFSKAVEEYPYLADKDIAYTFTPSKDDRYLEFYPPEEIGSPEYPRPETLPVGKVGIQVFNPKTRTIDILGDYVSHYGVENDPKLKEMYGTFTQTVPEAFMRNRYQEHQRKFNEARPYADWYKQTGMPEYFRGYTFNQWGNADQMYTPQQLEILNQIRQYLGIK